MFNYFWIYEAWFSQLKGIMYKCFKRIYEAWLLQLKGIMYKCFKRITVKPGRRSILINKMIDKKRRIKVKLTKVKQITGEGVTSAFLRNKLENQVVKLVNQISKEKSDNMKKQLKNILDTGQVHINEIWKIRSRARNKREQRIAVQNEEGNLLLEDNDIKAIYYRYYKELLKVRDPVPQALDYADEIDKLFEINMKIVSYDEEKNK